VHKREIRLREDISIPPADSKTTLMVKMESVLSTVPNDESTKKDVTAESASTVVTSESKTLNQDLSENAKPSEDFAKTTEPTPFPTDKKPIPLGINTNTIPAENVEESAEKVTQTTEEIKGDLSELLSFEGKDQRKRKRCENENDEENMDVILNVFLRSMYPLNLNMDKTITVGVFKSLDFNPGVLINHSGKASLLLTIDMWDKFTKYISIIEAYLYNNLTGRKTTIGFDDSDLEIDNIRLRGTQFVRFRDLSKHNKKILLTLEEFQVLSNLTPVIIRYMQQLVTYGPIIFDYLNSSVNTNPVVPLIYGPIDPSIYNRLPQEVSFYRKTRFFFNKLRSEGTKIKVSPTTELQENITFNNISNEEKV
jgi:hypothetical protein